MRVLYFAWLRQKIGKSEESLAPPPSVATVGGLVDWLKQQSPGHAAAFANVKAVRVAINQEFSDWAAPIQAGDEIAFFPPVTGG